MSQSRAYLALDLGAESGRAILGRFQSGTLTFEEVHRFLNEPVLYNDELHWDTPRLWLEIQRALSLVGTKLGIKLDGIGLDTWGVDYALLGEKGTLLDNPFHYRDGRTDGMLERVFAVVPAEEVFDRTGIQFMQLNTLFQLYAAHLKRPKLLQMAEKLLFTPDLFNYWMTGVGVCEFTIASTSQCYDPRQKRWATELFEKLGMPAHFLLPMVQPGTVLGPLQSSVAKAVGTGEVPVIAPACHDTGSAIAAIESAGQSAYISCGTWSLLGTEITEPIINPESRRLNFTNEGGVCGTIRLLKNIPGLWLLQCCRRQWQLEGREYSYAELAEAAASKPAFRSLVDTDHSSFLHPENMAQSIADYCQKTDQPAPEDPPSYTRAILESLALKYRLTLEMLERLTGRNYKEVHLVGGGARNTLLNQFTADATGCRVIAGPIEATALGNLGMQMLATGAVGSLAEVRRVIANSFPAQVFEPREPEKWQPALERFRQYCSSGSPS